MGSLARDRYHRPRRTTLSRCRGVSGFHFDVTTTEHAFDAIVPDGVGVKAVLHEERDRDAAIEKSCEAARADAVRALVLGDAQPGAGGGWGRDMVDAW
jgi:hypothetical protein